MRALWLRLYTSVLDPEDKTQNLTDRQFRFWILLCVAYKRNKCRMPDDRSLARLLQISTGKVRSIFESMPSLFDVDGESFKPHDWDEHQYASDASADRVRRYRERHRNVTSDVTVTCSESREQRAEKNSGVLLASGVESPPAEKIPEPKAPGNAWKRAGVLLPPELLEKAYDPEKLSEFLGQLSLYREHCARNLPEPDVNLARQLYDAFHRDAEALAAWLPTIRHVKPRTWGLVVMKAQTRAGKVIGSV